MIWKAAIVASTIAAPLLVATPSFATSCWVEPFNRLVVDDGDTIPVNVPGIAWLTNLGVPPLITITNDEDVEVEFTITRDDGLQFIRPVDWAQGNTYHIVLKVVSDEANNSTNNATNNALAVEFRDLDQTIVVGPPLAIMMPRSFDVSPLETGVTYDDYLEPRDSVWVNIQANFLDDPTSNFYLYTTFVDGVEYRFSEGCEYAEIWPGRKKYGPGSDRLVVLCKKEEFRLKPGDHEFQLEVKIMGTTTKELSSPLPVNIPCAESETLDTEQDEDMGSSNNQTVESGCASIKSDRSLVLLLLGFLMFRRRVAHLELDGK